MNSGNDKVLQPDLSYLKDFTGVFFCSFVHNNIPIGLGALREIISKPPFDRAEFLQLVIQQEIKQGKVVGSMEILFHCIAVLKFPKVETTDISH